MKISKMQRILSIIALILTSSCANTSRTVWIDPALQSLVTEFYEEAKVRDIYPEDYNLIVKFVESKELNTNTDPNLTTVGQCNLFEGQPTTVLISKEYWAVMNVMCNDPLMSASCQLQKKALIWHELGHCLLGRHHNEAITVTEDFINGDPSLGYHYKRSIMHPNIKIGYPFFADHYKEYVDELFGVGEGPN